jgi:hypothetical protein
MSDERMDRARTDEPDGTPAYTASLRSPGESVRPTGRPDVGDQEIAPDAAPAGDDPVAARPGAGAGRAAGYDVEAVSGDSEIYRPE